jgi:hypothetical protein
MEGGLATGENRKIVGQTISQNYSCEGAQLARPIEVNLLRELARKRSKDGGGKEITILPQRAEDAGMGRAWVAKHEINAGKRQINGDK